MKNQFIMKIISLFSLVLVVSCTSDDKKAEELKSKSFQELMKSEVGVIDGNEVLLDISKDELVAKFKDYAKEIALGVEPYKVEIINVDSSNYLRFYNTNKTVSTVALIEKANIAAKLPPVELGNTVCTSVQCATGGGCLPNGDYCTVCIPPGTQPGSGITRDCTRSTSGG